jgi:hypothetical protein
VWRPELSFRSIAIGQTAYAWVYADKLWNDSGIDVISGQSYTLAVPTSERWVDDWKSCGAEGYTSSSLMRPLEFFRRVREARWFQLVGTIGRSRKQAVVIGSKLTEFLPQFPGRLYFFANDVLWMYWNHKGAIAVRITRTK